MGVGQGFSFGAIEFALLESLEIDRPVYFPNPFGFIALKVCSYLDAPESRVRDFADIIELVWGLVENGIHFQLGELWAKVRQNTGAESTTKILYEIANDSGNVFDLVQLERAFEEELQEQ